MSRPGARWVTPLVLLLLVAGHVLVLREVYITHRFTITHDSIANIGPYQFAFTGVRTGTLPLWSPEMNAGEPLWPIVELHPAYEPVPLLVFAIASWVGATGVTAFSFVLLSWLIGFAGGGWLLARAAGLSPVSRILVFTVLLWSSLGILILYQSQYLVIARWVPLVLALGWWLLQGPGLGRAILFGIVLGIALPGYQTPYLALFGLVLACAGGRDTLDCLRRVPRHVLGVVVVFTLAILLPTFTAAAEWLSMVPVARLAWPRGTRGVLLPDALAPLLGQLNTESTLYVGVMPLLLALVAAVVGASGADRRASFWLRTTLGTLLLFCGVPEMITGRDQPFLFVRDWSFVLPLVVLGLAMLAGIGLDHVRARVGPRWAAPVAIALTVLALLDLSAFAATHYGRLAFPRSPELQAREPAPIQPRATSIPELRLREFDIAAHAPFHKQGPAVLGVPSAYMDPEAFRPPQPALVALGQIYTHGSHYFRLPRYDAVLGSLPRPAFDCIAGATCPVLRVVGHAIPASDFGTALASLARTPIDGLRDTIVVEGDAGVADRGADPVGRVRVRTYHASTRELDVVMSRPGFLYYADGYTPDWVATVDGAPAPVLAADGAFKAVPVPSGSHRVTLAYRPWRYITAFTVRALAIVGGLAMVVWLRRAEPGRPTEGMESAGEAR